MTILCEKCGGASKVVDSRDLSGSKYRRRECKACKHRWSTMEYEVTHRVRFKSSAAALLKNADQMSQQLAQQTSTLKKVLDEV